MPESTTSQQHTVRFPANEAPCPTLEHLKNLAEKSMPITITFIPHRLTKRFARVFSSKLNVRGIDTQEREMLNLLYGRYQLSF